MLDRNLGNIEPLIIQNVVLAHPFVKTSSSHYNNLGYKWYISVDDPSSLSFFLHLLLNWLLLVVVSYNYYLWRPRKNKNKYDRCTHLFLTIYFLSFYYVPDRESFFFIYHLFKVV